MKRREILKAAGAGVTAQALRGNSANDRVRVALTGVRGRGRDHIASLATMRGVEIATLCDVDEGLLAMSGGEVERLTGRRPACETDFRKVLDDRSIDAVTIATPNHWHTLQTIWACQAGKDVYVEKPCSHNLYESRQVVAAAHRYERIVQHGTQYRSAPAVRESISRLHSGVIGEVYLARALCFKWRDSIGRAVAEPVPAGVHYDQWVGPAPMRPFTRNRFHYNWHWQWNYGNGEIGNQCVHEIDIARWGLGVRYPDRVTATGGHVLFDDDQETPNALTANFSFGDGPQRKLLVVDIRPAATQPEAGVMVGNVFYGSNGILSRTLGAYQLWLGRDRQPERNGPEDHFGNFISAMRSRDTHSLHAGIEEGAVTCDLIHLANISYCLGRSLQFDANTMRCIGDEEANRMFTRRYRAPYIVPDRV